MLLFPSECLSLHAHTYIHTCNAYACYFVADTAWQCCVHNETTFSRVYVCVYMINSCI